MHRFCGINLNRDEPSNPDYGKIVDALTTDDEKRADFMKACLTKLGLEVSQETTPVPSLSHLHLSSAVPSDIAALLDSWREAGILVTENDNIYIKGENDTFHLQQTDGWSMADVAQAVAEILPEPVKNAVTSASSSRKNQDKNATDNTSRDRLLDYNALTKTLVPHPTSLPDPKSTPHFNHAAFFAHLQSQQSQHTGLAGDYGRTLLYAEVLTSTQTILDKNPTWLSHLPIGTTAVATTQVSGRGRGNNVWVSPPGSLMFTTLLRHPLSLSASSPVVFVQYIAALAIVEGVHAYSTASSQQSKAYASLPIKLKWPNDIYALGSPTADPALPDSWTKIAGILVNSSYASGDYTVLIGIGLNALNAQPTTSLSQIFAAAGLPPPQLEALLASILVSFEALYARFCSCGWDGSFQELYYRHWLHDGQIVKLEQEGGVEVRVKGISSDWGMLVVEEVVERGYGRRWELMSDGNSFDFFKGLVRRKV